GHRAAQHGLSDHLPTLTCFNFRCGRLVAAFCDTSVAVRGGHLPPPPSPSEPEPPRSSSRRPPSADATNVGPAAPPSPCLSRCCAAALIRQSTEISSAVTPTLPSAAA